VICVSRPDVYFSQRCLTALVAARYYRIFSYSRLIALSLLGNCTFGPQKRFSLFGKCLDMIMIARRSRYYAGTRYLKRGINVHGKAANDCEVEQVGMDCTCRRPPRTRCSCICCRIARVDVLRVVASR
jgi:hypothetical protein